VDTQLHALSPSCPLLASVCRGKWVRLQNTSHPFRPCTLDTHTHTHTHVHTHTQPQLDPCTCTCVCVCMHSHSHTHTHTHSLSLELSVACRCISPKPDKPSPDAPPGGLASLLRLRCHALPSRVHGPATRRLPLRPCAAPSTPPVFSECSPPPRCLRRDPQTRGPSLEAHLPDQVLPLSGVAACVCLSRVGGGEEWAWFPGGAWFPGVRVCGGREDWRESRGWQPHLSRNGHFCFLRFSTETGGILRTTMDAQN
jgi:hypothetical protein